MKRYGVGTRGMVAMLTLAIGVSTVFANGFRNPPESASALGQVGSRMTLVEDPSALSFNPANLSTIEEPSVMGSLLYARGRTEFDAPDGRSGKTRSPGNVLPNLHAAWPLAEYDVVAGVGVTTPFGQSTKWKKDGPFQYVGPHHAEMTLVNFSPAVALRVRDDVSVGVTANIYWSELELRQMVPWSMFAPMLPDGEARLKGDGFGFGGSAGITWNMTDRQRVALVYKAPFDIDYEGSTRLGNVPPGAAAPRSDFDSKIKFPTIVAFGYGLQVTDRIRVGLDVEWIEFSRFENLPLDLGVNNPLGLTPESIPQDWKDTWTVGLGADWTLASPWTVRCGYIFMESPIPSRTVSPSLPDTDRHVLAFGVTWERGANGVDFAYAYTIFDDLKVGDNQNPAYNGEYDMSSHLFQLSYRRVF